MAKRTVKEKEVVTLGIVFGDMAINVRFTFASKLARLTHENDLQDGQKLFDRHFAAGNIVEDKTVGLFPGAKTYRIAKPQAPALI
jgi:hypothetical protein